MHYLPGASGLQIAADSWGDLDGPLVILMHGGGQTRHAWRTTGRSLGAAGYCAVAIDLRGHGDSDWAADGDYSRQAFVRDLESVVTTLRRDKPILVGASMGAEVALVAAACGTPNAAALVMVDFAPQTESEGHERSKTFMAAHADGFSSLDEMADAIANYKGGQRPRNLDGLAKVVRRRANGRYYWHWDPRLLESRVQEFQTRHASLSTCATRLETPMLLVRGGSSDVLSKSGAEEFLRQVPHGEYIEIPGVGHMIAGDRNDEFGRGVAEFLSRVAPSASHLAGGVKL